MFRYIQKLYRFQLFEQTSDSGSFVCWFEKSADDSCSGNSASGKVWKIVTVYTADRHDWNLYGLTDRFQGFDGKL